MYEKKEDNKQQTILGNQSIFLKEVASSDAISKFSSDNQENKILELDSYFNYPEVQLIIWTEYTCMFVETIRIHLIFERFNYNLP